MELTFMEYTQNLFSFANSSRVALDKIEKTIINIAVKLVSSKYSKSKEYSTRTSITDNIGLT